jgi:hypothetical protein
MLDLARASAVVTDVDSVEQNQATPVTMVMPST